MVSTFLSVLSLITIWASLVSSSRISSGMFSFISLNNASGKVFKFRNNVYEQKKDYVKKGKPVYAIVPVTVYLPLDEDQHSNKGGEGDSKQNDLMSFLDDPINLNFDTEKTILDNLKTHFEEGGLNQEPPFSCCVGLCTECAALVVQGQTNVELEAAVLDEETTKKGFVLTCSSKVKGEGVKLLLRQHEKMYDSQYGNFVKDHASFQESPETLEKGSSGKKRGGGILDAVNAVLNLNVEA